MSSNESIFTTVPFPTREDRKIQKQKRRHMRKVAATVLAIIIGTAAGVTSGVVGADAVSQTTINKYIRAHGGIAPCVHEDGSGQPGNCYWDASERGNGKGHDYIAVSQGPNKDKAIVFITGPKAKRY
jgi:hypothetical protein